MQKSLRIFTVYTGHQEMKKGRKSTRRPTEKTFGGRDHDTE